MGASYRVVFQMKGQQVFAVEGLESVSEQEMKDRLSWYRRQYGAEFEVRTVERVSGPLERQVYDRYGSPLCWHCLTLAVARCSICGCACCGECAWPMRPEAREVLHIPCGALAVECLACVCQ